MLSRLKLNLFISLFVLPMGFAEVLGVNAVHAVHAAPPSNWYETYDFGGAISQVVSEKPGEPAVLRAQAVSIGTDDQPVTAYYDTADMNLRFVSLGRIKFVGTPWNGKHGGNSHLQGEMFLKNAPTLSWAHEGSWKDPRENVFAPVPDQYVEYLGNYRAGHKVIYSYTVGKDRSQVYESPRAIRVGDMTVFVRHFTIPATKSELRLKVADSEAIDDKLKVSLAGADFKFERAKDHKHLMFIRIPAGQKDLSFSLSYSMGEAFQDSKVEDLTRLLKGGKARWPQVLTLKGEKATSKSDSFVVDQIPAPVDNPWQSRIRFGGFDYFPDGKRAAFCTWNGDVWIASDLDNLDAVKWKRFAAGLNEALGICIADGKIMVTGKDQVTRLHDLNGDGEADYYECFNNDHMITKNFHEFTFGLQRDKASNFYFAKGSPVRGGGRGFEITHANHGVIYKISPDGSDSEVFASGLRAPGGLGVHPSGEIVTTGENEGTYVPACKINYASKGDFLGVIHPGNDKKEAEGFTQPLCWLPMNVDNSGGGQVWVPEGAWGDFGGSLIHLSYGKSSVFAVLKEELEGGIDGKLPGNESLHPGVQGGVVRLPIDLMSSGMRIRFNPADHNEAIVAGFKGWQTNAARETAINRIRYTGTIFSRPVDIRSTEKGVYLTFNEKLDPAMANQAENFQIERWNYLYSGQYGSGHFSLDMSDDELKPWTAKESKRVYRLGGIPRNQEGETGYVTASKLMADGKTVFLKIHDMQPVDQMKIGYDLKTESGKKLNQQIYHTIHVTSSDDMEVPDQIDAEEMIKKEKLARSSKGVLMAFKDGQGNIDAVTKRLLSLEVPQGEFATPFMSTKEFSVKATALLQVDRKDKMAFAAEGSGTFSLKLNGEEILSFSGENQNVTSKLIRIKKDYHQLELKFTSNPDGDSRFMVKWDGGFFPMEPISPNQLLAESNETQGRSLAMREGRMLYAQKHCAACHGGQELKEAGVMPELLATTPDLQGVGGRYHQGWLARWIENPKALKPMAHMPGTRDKTKARDLAAYLVSLGGEDLSGQVSGDVKAGGGLFYDLGCIACHDAPNKKAKSQDRVPLANVAAKFKPAALVSFLKQPDKHNAWIKMPNFGLSDKEAADLASFLLEKSATQSMKTEKGDPVRGKKLFASEGCASCHQGMGKSTMKSKRKLVVKRRIRDSACIGKKPKVNYGLSGQEKNVLATFLRGGQSSLVRHSLAEFADRQIKELNCQACHAMDGKNAKWENYLGEVADFKVEHKDGKGHLDQSRPQLTFAGEKLNVKHIHGFLSGDLPYKQDGHVQLRDWLLARMPAFPARAEKLAKGMALQHAMYAKQAKPDSGITSTPELVTAGKKLVGQMGYSCIICHPVGEQKALAAFEVKGVNLKATRERMTYQYYQRWMLNPPHVVPGTKMPKYVDDKGKAGLPDFGRDGNKQFEAIWHYLLEHR